MPSKSVKKPTVRVRTKSMRSKVSSAKLPTRKPSKKKSKNNSLGPVNMAKLEGTQFFCVSCGNVVHGKNVLQTKTRNKRDALKGQCVECGTNMFRFLSNNNK